MWAYDFMQHAFMAGTLIAITCGLISPFIILRRNAFAAHALSHTSLTGAAGAMLIGFSTLTGQLILNIFAGILMGIIGDKVKKNDLAVSVVLTFFLGLGTYFLFLYQNHYNGDIMGLFFGNILAVSISQIKTLLILGLFVALLISCCMRRLLFASIDPIIAQANHVSLRIQSIFFFVLLSIAVSMACQIVGVLLVFALLVLPGAISAQYCKSFYGMLMVSIVSSTASTWGALTLAYHTNLPISFCLTMILIFLYCLKTLFSALSSTPSSIT